MYTLNQLSEIHRANRAKWNQIPEADRGIIRRQIDRFIYIHGLTPAAAILAEAAELDRLLTPAAIDSPEAAQREKTYQTARAAAIQYATNQYEGI